MDRTSGFFLLPQAFMAQMLPATTGCRRPEAALRGCLLPALGNEASRSPPINSVYDRLERRRSAGLSFVLDGTVLFGCLESP